jgi:hypothetical protein
MPIAVSIACGAASAVIRTVRQDTRDSDIHRVDHKLPRRCIHFPPGRMLVEAYYIF